MRTKLSICTFALGTLIVFFFNRPVFSQEAQEGNFDLVYEEYLLNLEEYQVAHDDYILRRAQYLRFGTQKSREDAHAATLKMLQERDDVIITYLRSLEERLKESDGLSDDLRDDLLVELQEEVLWYEEHRQELETAVSLTDLVKDSDKAERRYSEQVEEISYKSLPYLSYGKFNALQKRLDEVFEDLKEKVGDIKVEERDEFQLSGEKLLTIDRWIVESERHIARSREKSDESLEYAFGSETNKKIDLRSYNSALDRLEESRILLHETVTFLKEVTRQIKIKEVYD